MEPAKVKYRRVGACFNAFGANAESISPNIGRGHGQSHDVHWTFAGASKLCVEARLKLLAIEVHVAGQLTNEL
jgi:metal-dependent amidase/aminoacylase/carboxypeptidase family protein